MPKQKQATPPVWTLEQLQQHLQYAVDLELWTIPFYMSSMYSIKDAGNLAYQLIQSVAYQEMLHVQLAANLANAYGVDVSIGLAAYEGTTIPHLDFDIDHPNPVPNYSPYTCEIGPFNLERINTMCLIEYPNWLVFSDGYPLPSWENYGSIAEFYASVSMGAVQLIEHVQPRNQVDHFSKFYANFRNQTITRSGAAAADEVALLVKAICDQGEGASACSPGIAPEFQNTTDDPKPAWTHFEKFAAILAACRKGGFPETYSGLPYGETSGKAREAQDILLEEFKAFQDSAAVMFAGKPAPEFGQRMAMLGGAILNCWKNGALPVFPTHEAKAAAFSTQARKKGVLEHA